MPRLGEVIRDTLGISGYMQGVEFSKRENKRKINQVLTGLGGAETQIAFPLTHIVIADPSSGLLNHIETGVAIEVGAITLVVVLAGLNHPEAAIGAKVVYNAAVSIFDRQKSLKPESQL